MMLNGQPGSMATGRGWLPAGASQASKAALSMRSVGAGQATHSASAITSTKTMRAEQSAAIPASCAGVDEGASGATASPARKAPTKTAR